MYRDVTKDHPGRVRCKGLKALLAVSLLALGAPVQAFPNMGLFLELRDSPDLGASAINVDYDSGTGALSASGSASNLRLNGVDHDIDAVGGGSATLGTFMLTATINSATGEATSGSLTIGGEIPSLSLSGPTLLFSNALTGFGSGPAGTDRLDFLFGNLTGDAAQYFGGATGAAGVILADAGFLGGTPAQFQSDFGSGGLAVADTGIAAVPEPGTLGLMLVGSWLFFPRKRSC